MKTIKIVLFIILNVMLSVETYSQTWSNDPFHSRLGFTVSRNTMLDVSGVFRNFEITIDSSKPDYSDAIISLEVETSSINTEVEMRDNHLRNEEFLDVARYPKMIFMSTEVSKIDVGTLQVKGNLTLRGTSKPIILTMKLMGKTYDERSKKDQIGIKVTGYFNRTDFNVGSKESIPMIGDRVDIVADILMQK